MTGLVLFIQLSSCGYRFSLLESNSKFRKSVPLLTKYLHNLIVSQITRSRLYLKPSLEMISLF